MWVGLEAILADPGWEAGIHPRQVVMSQRPRGWNQVQNLFGDSANLCTAVSPPVTIVFTTTTADHNHKNRSEAQITFLKLDDLTTTIIYNLFILFYLFIIKQKIYLLRRKLHWPYQSVVFQTWKKIYKICFCEIVFRTEQWTQLIPPLLRF